MFPELCATHLAWYLSHTTTTPHNPHNTSVSSHFYTASIASSYILPTNRLSTGLFTFFFTFAPCYRLNFPISAAAKLFCNLHRPSVSRGKCPFISISPHNPRIPNDSYFASLLYQLIHESHSPLPLPHVLLPTPVRLLPLLHIPRNTPFLKIISPNLLPFPLRHEHRSPCPTTRL